jgi:hypothetical protein
MRRISHLDLSRRNAGQIQVGKVEQLNWPTRARQIDLPKEQAPGHVRIGIEQFRDKAKGDNSTTSAGKELHVCGAAALVVVTQNRRTCLRANTRGAAIYPVQERKTPTLPEGQMAAALPVQFERVERVALQMPC